MKMIGLVRLGRDADVRFTASGDPVASLAMAFSYGQKKDGGQPTQWIDAGLWGKRAESLAPHLTKGTQLCVTLSDVHIVEYKAKDGTTKTSLRAKVDDLQFAGSKQEGKQESRQAPQKTAPKAAPAKGAFDDFEDSIPF